MESNLECPLSPTQTMATLTRLATNFTLSLRTYSFFQIPNMCKNVLIILIHANKILCLLQISRRNIGYPNLKKRMTEQKFVSFKEKRNQYPVTQFLYLINRLSSFLVILIRRSRCSMWSVLWLKNFIIKLSFAW